VVCLCTEMILVSELHMGILAKLVVDGVVAQEMDSHTIPMVAFHRGLYYIAMSSQFGDKII